jgi:elongation factor G
MITLPIGEENDFRGIVDLVKPKFFIVWHEEVVWATFDVVAIPEEMLEEVKGI